MNFEVGGWVLVKLRPRRQTTVTGSKYSKLAKRFYDPFQVIQWIGVVAYKLELPPTSKIHPVFHCCLLKPFQFQSTTTDPSLELPALLEDNQPLTILDTKWEQTASGRQLLVLVQWTGLLPEDTSWEKWENLKEDYNLEDRVVLEAWRDVMNEDT